MNSFPTMPTMERRISGAERGPSDISRILATVPFHTGTSTTSCSPFSPDTVISFVLEVIESSESRFIIGRTLFKYLDLNMTLSKYRPFI